ncbi:MAG: hypothetical protein JXJ04_25100, partial [Spirochaetales bacterium]|nr:hypothetical protein [Spirochaetales bacterium]
MPLHTKEYSPRSHGKWKEQKHLCWLAPDGWKEKQVIVAVVPQEEEEKASRETPVVGTKQQRSAWASFPMETELIKLHLLLIRIRIRRSRNTPFFPTIGIRRSRNTPFFPTIGIRRSRNT